MSNRITKHFESLSDSSIKLLSLSSLFDKDFSIDWLIQLTNNKASCILSTLEKLCKEQLLINIGNGWYRFSDFKSKESFQCHLSNHEKQKIHRRISTILMNEASDDENKAIYLTKHLMEIENDIEGCKWLIKAAEISKANYQIEDSLQIYSKAIDDLLKINNVTTDKLFVKAALNYSKLSTARQNTDHVIEILKEAMTRTVRNGDKTCKILLEMHMAKNEWLRSHPSRAFRHFKSGMTMAQKLDDSSLMPSVKTFGTFFLYFINSSKASFSS
ncbi:MAG: hypothetical protein ACOC4Y_02070, partial [bacterium]